MRTHLYAGERGRIVAVDDNDEARDAVVLCRMPPPLFDGKPVPYLVAKAYLHEHGGLWFRHTGLHRMKPGLHGHVTENGSEDHGPPCLTRVRHVAACDPDRSVVTV
ncbi:hypothetical protein [uncultured Abyssibacter sp.]|uniref:hypothetical protein n=1 Tax=uncultured Abyssibacter sp. TaxID=2320202 RepID=UPI0032B2FF9E